MGSRESVPRVVTVVGTRPEAIKMAPVVRALLQRSRSLRHTLVSTRQHVEVLDQAFDAFALRPDVDLALGGRGRTLGEFAGESLAAISRVIADIKPALVLVQGDTTTTLAGALAATYQGVPVAHVEAGLRSFDSKNPFPEELNRRCVSNLASLHFAPTERARYNLLRESVAPETIFVTGNTVIDAMAGFRPDTPFDHRPLDEIDFGKRVVLVTAHRRENHRHLREICGALKRIAAEFSDCQLIFPVHPSPEVRGVVTGELRNVRGIALLAPLGYADCLRVLGRCHFVLTDSGGLQEEAPSFGKPVLILRSTTERPELVEAGGGRLVGVSGEGIVRACGDLLQSAAAYEAMCLKHNPYGDGLAALRIAAVVEAEVTRDSRSPANTLAPLLPAPYRESSGMVAKRLRRTAHAPARRH